MRTKPTKWLNPEKQRNFFSEEEIEEQLEKDLRELEKATRIPNPHPDQLAGFRTRVTTWK